MRTAIPFLTGVTIVSATILGIAHVVGSDGELTALMRHALSAGSEWIDAIGQALWSALMQLL
ncbi:MAG: hypothetical protein HY243_09870 [Proteobacteria bacterium]|nr:hypothetical protein [Pseudomonadota bacterium]